MTKNRYTPAYPAELRERGVRLFRENRADYGSDTAAYKAIAPKLGCSPDSLRVWCQPLQHLGREICQSELHADMALRQSNGFGQFLNRGGLSGLHAPSPAHARPMALRMCRSWACSSLGR